jgi:hypothetical protein
MSRVVKLPFTWVTTGHRGGEQNQCQDCEMETTTPGAMVGLLVRN